MTFTKLTPRFLFITIAIFVAAISRLFPHIPNFTPIAAMALFGGVYFKDKSFAFIVPLLAMFISDCGLELMTGWGFHTTIVYVYVSFMLITVIGFYLKKGVQVKSVVLASLISSVLFFVITNFGVWAATGFQQGITGLILTYTNGIPFFGPTMAGDLFFNGILFGSYYLAQRKFPVLTIA